MPLAPLIITYTLHPPSTPHLKDALTGIQAQLPLRNLHWKSSSRTSLRTIQEVDVHLVDLGEVGPVREVAGSVLESPLVNVLLIACDDGEVYKNSTKTFIRDWLSLLAARRNVHAPLILLVNPPSAEHKGGKNVFGRDKGVLGKLKTDFNTGKRDRCAQVNLPLGSVADPAAWPEVINKLKESVIAAFDGAIHEREEEVKRGEAQRLTVGWNFCTWFLLKESLAHSFEGVNLHEDALIVYEELEASFFQVLKEQNLSWFGKLGATQAKDDSMPVLDTMSKPYRQMLQGSAISVFDFRVYVFARQATLLGKLGRITEIAKRGQWFVASLTRRLRESEADLAEHFIESWTYTACMDIVAKCDEWSRLDRPNGDYSGLIAYESARSELLDIARIQVERIGVAVGHLPNQYPFSPPTALVANTEDVLFESSDNGLSDNGEDQPPEEPRPKLSNAQLVDAVSDVTRFRNLFLGLTKKAMAAYEACGKINSVIRLQADLAGLALFTEEWNTAFDLCRGLAKRCAEQRIWDPVARFALEGALSSHRQLKLEKDEEWVHLGVSYLRVCAAKEEKADEAETEGLLPPREIAGVLEGLRGAGSLEVDGHAAFGMEFSSHEANIGDQGMPQIHLTVESSLPEAVELNDILIGAFDEYSGVIAFHSGPVRLSPGSNNVDLQTKSSVQGVFSLTDIALSLGKITFRYSAPEASVILRRSTSGPRAVISMPHNNQDSRVLVHIHTGPSDMRQARFSLLAIQDEVTFRPDATSISNQTIGKSCPSPIDRAEGIVMTADAGGISFASIPANQVLQLAIPYSGAAQSDSVKIRLQLSYTLADGSPRDFLDMQALSMALPLTVNVQDFFRPECLVSHFTIAVDGSEYLRIGGVELRGREVVPYDIEACGLSKETRIIAPDQSLSCLFKLTPQKSRARDRDEVLRLAIRYRSIDEEVRALVAALKGEEKQRALAELSDRSWLATYVSTGQLPLGLTLPADSLSESEHWRTLEIPVDVPSRRLLCTVHIATEVDGAVYEGRSIPVTLSFTTSLTWSGEPPGAEQGQRLVFDVQAAPEDWIVLGRNKGFFASSTTSPHTTQITLIPMRSGLLALPSVSIQLLSAFSGAPQPNEDELLCETYVENAAETIRVLPSRREVTALVPIRREWDVIEEGREAIGA